MADPPLPDPALLNPVERRVLQLLAQGHTAKSIAGELELSIHAVNERLREARRKTGAGSSRELARQLAAARTAQEDRPDEMELAAWSSRFQPGAGPAHGAWLRLGVPIMILAALFAVAALPSSQADAPVEDDLLGPLLNKNGPDAQELHTRVRAQPRDPAAEALVRARYRAIPALSDAPTLRVICGVSLCEVAADVPSGHSLVAIQRMGLSGLRRAGFRSSYFKVGAGKSRPTFVTYLMRGADGR